MEVKLTPRITGREIAAILTRDGYKVFWMSVRRGLMPYRTLEPRGFAVKRGNFEKWAEAHKRYLRPALFA